MTKETAKKEIFDLQDFLVCAGAALLIGGVAIISYPVAMILAGCMFLLAACLIQRTKKTS